MIYISCSSYNKKPSELLPMFIRICRKNIINADTCRYENIEFKSELYMLGEAIFSNVRGGTYDSLRTAGVTHLRHKAKHKLLLIANLLCETC